MKLLVTGGAGYIGSIVAARLVGDGHEVVVFDNLQHGHREAVPLPARLVEADLLDREAVLLTLSEGFDAVLHFAALALVGESVNHPGALLPNERRRNSEPARGDDDVGRFATRFLVDVRRLWAAR